MSGNRLPYCLSATYGFHLEFGHGLLEDESDSPCQEIVGERLLLELPAIVGYSAELHAIWAGCEGLLHDPTSIDQHLPGIAVDAHGVPEVRLEELVQLQ